jgi:hypothetical protein
MEDISKVDTKRENKEEERRNVINRQEKQKHSSCETKRDRFICR